LEAADSGLFKIAVTREDHDKAKEIPVITSYRQRTKPLSPESELQLCQSAGNMRGFQDGDDSCSGTPGCDTFSSFSR